MKLLLEATSKIGGMPLFIELFSINRKRKSWKKPTFRHLKAIHIKYFRKLMSAEKTRNLTIDQKTSLLKKTFPKLKIARPTLYKLQSKYLGYTHKSFLTISLTPL